MLRRFPPQTLSPGDVIASNDPVIGTGHMFDLALMKPIFRGGRIVAYAMSITHLPDIGGMGFSAAATEIYHEGLRLPIWKLFAAGQRDETLIELIKLNVRVPEQVLGDIMASVSCLEVVDRQLGEFLSEAGLADVDDLAVSIIDQTEAAVRAALVAIPDGVYGNEVEVEASATYGGSSAGSTSEAARRRSILPGRAPASWPASTCRCLIRARWHSTR